MNRRILRTRACRSPTSGRSSNITEGERRGAGAETYIDLVPEDFREHIAMMVTVKNGLVERAALEVRRPWALDQQRGANPLALDITGRFVGAFASVVDAETSATIGSRR